MKTLRFVIFGLLATTAICSAQPITQPGWFRAPHRMATNLPPANVAASEGTIQPQVKTAGAQKFSMLSQMNEPDTPIAEAITPEIQALADGLQDDPLRIYNYVHDHIRYVLYFGSKKGAQLTLLEKSGNDFDQAALLVALLRAAGFSNSQGSDRGVGYQFGWEGLPYDSTNHADLRHLLGLSLTNSNWRITSNYLMGLFLDRGYPTFYFVPGDTNQFLFQRVWVTLTVGSTNYYLDPAFKISEPIAGISLNNALGFSSDALMAAAAGTDTGNYVSNLNEVAIRGTLTGYTTNLLNYIQSNSPNASVQQILGGQYIVPSTNTTLPTSLLFPTYTWNQPGVAVMPIVNWNNEPTNLMASLSISIGYAVGNFYVSTSGKWWVPQLQGQRLTLNISTNNGNGYNMCQLFMDDTPGLNLLGMGNTYSIGLSIDQPFGAWDYVNNALIDDGYCDTSSSIPYNVNPATNVVNTYAILYAFEPDWGWLQERQHKLDAYRQQGLPDSSPQVIAETLNIMGLNWMLQTEAAENLLALQLGILPQWHHRLGRMAQEIGNGYFVDVYMELSGERSKAGYTSAYVDYEDREFDLFGYFGSALEHGMIEQLQSSNLVAASTVKMLQIANTNKQAVYLASSGNWTTGANISTNLVNYDSDTLSTITSLIASSYYVLLPRNGSNHVAGGAKWAGYGYVAHYNQSGNAEMQMIISGGYHGGYSGNPTTADPRYVQGAGEADPQANTAAQIGTSNPTIADPVDTVDGTFQVEHADLALGQTEPRGITLSRYYNGTRRYNNPVGMAGGWIHNYYATATTVPAPQAGLGGTTPAQMAPMLAATCAAVGSYGTSPDPKNWMVTALIAKWGIDQLTKNGVSVILGKDTLQFIQQPNGAYTPPANCTMTLVPNGAGFNLLERRGRTFEFDATGKLNFIQDQYHHSIMSELTLRYNASNWVSSIKDCYGRQFTFNYTGSPALLTSISDGARTVTYGYATTYNPQGDLVSATDPDGNTTTYVYDANHQIVATYDALNQLVVNNVYDGFGHVTTQYTQGDPNKTWRVFWSGWQTVEQDPAGSQRTFFYDNQSRLVGLQDQLGNRTQTIYDGQNHVTTTVSPLNETNRFIYDGKHNLLYSIDPLNFTNQFVYDSIFNLIRSVDARGNASTFGYNAQFSLTGSTNGAGDWVNYAYNLNGTLQTRTDAGGSIAYRYDSYEQLTSITYPNSLGVEYFVISPQGDVTSHTNARGFATTFSYNNRRQLTNTIAPTNLTTTLSYDAVGNLQTSTDARGNTTRNTWSPTRKLLATALPPMPQGVPVVTNVYDGRDWLVRALDPFQQPTQFTNDVAGRLIATTDPLQRTTSFGYDADGHQVTATNAAQETNSQLWSVRGELIQSTDNAGHSVLRGYDKAGNQIALTNRNGKVWQFQFDGANRLTNTITPLGRSTSLAFNHQGLVASLKDPASQLTSLYYDAKGRLTNRTDNVATTLYGYDANDNLTSVTNVGQASSLSQTFDAYNRMSSFKDVYGNLIQYQYDGNGNLTNLVYPGGKNVYYSYDSNNHLTNVLDWEGRTSTMTYDLAGRLTSITRPNGTARLIGYDAAGQTTNIIEVTPNNVPIAFFRLNWNNAARVQWEFAAPLPHSYTPPSRMNTYDDDDRLATFNGQGVSSDPDGNLTSAPLTNSTMVTYTYDARNRLMNAGGVTNAYDAMNNRVGLIYGTNTTIFVVNPNAKLPQVLMRIKNGVTYYYVYGPGLLYQVTETATATNTLTYHYDYRGSTIALSDNNGNVTDRIEYSAYGLTTYRAGTNDTPFLFNGRYGVQSDPNGLLYMRARYYNPYLCRFLNPDPTGFKGGLNHYAAFNGNPVSYIDPFGLGAVGENVNTSWVNPNNNIFGLYQQALAAQGEGIDYFDSEALGNGLNNTVTAMGHTAGQGLYDLSQGQWSSSQWNQIGGQLYSTATPENPAATPYVEAILGQTATTELTLGLSAAAFYAPGTSIFYSGAGAKATATSLANAGGGSTIYNTFGGSMLQNLGVQNNLVWRGASWFYANTTGSEAIAVLGEGGGVIGTTLGDVEAPVLLQRSVQVLTW